MLNADRRCSFVPLIRSAYHDIAKPRGRSAMAGAHHLLRLSLAAVRSAPQRAFLARADGVHRVPELSCDAQVGRVLQHASALASHDLPAYLATKLKVEAFVVDGPRTIGLHQDEIGRATCR